MEETREGITELLLAHKEGDRASFDLLVDVVYGDLRRIAGGQIRRSPHATLNPTALVHEAYEKLVDETRVSWKDRGHFFAIAALTMRRLLVDHARKRMAGKRGSGEAPVTLDAERVSLEEQAELVLAVDTALESLASFNERLARVVEHRFFAGLTVEETAQSLGVTTRTIERDWVRAKAWLAEKLG